MPALILFFGKRKYYYIMLLVTGVKIRKKMPVEVMTGGCPDQFLARDFPLFFTKTKKHGKISSFTGWLVSERGKVYPLRFFSTILSRWIQIYLKFTRTRSLGRYISLRTVSIMK
jgi:hypothetical protein